MPLHPDFKKILDRMIKQYGAEKGKKVFYSWLNSKGYDDTKPFPGKKEGAEVLINERIKFSVPFVVESLEAKEGETSIEEASCRKIKGTMLKATTSRNGRTYTMENIEKAKFSGDTISLNHTEDVTDNVGTFKPSLTKDGVDFEAVVYNTGKHPYVTDMIDKGLIKFTSIEAIAGELVNEGDQMIAKDIDITGLGLVKTPGIPEATFAISEAFENNLGDRMEETKETPPAPVETHTDGIKELIGELKTSNANLAKKYEEEAAMLKKEIASLKESKSKGIVTEAPKLPFELKKVKEKDGTISFFCEDKFLY